MSETVDQAKRRYTAAMHAVQSGIATEIAIPNGPQETTPKHLRVGVNGAHIGYSAIAHLLIAKGIITELEFFTKLADLAEDEKRDYEQRLSQYFEKPVTLS